MSVNIPECPISLKAIQHYLKAALEHDSRDPVVSYWCRLHALQLGLKMSSKKTPEETQLLVSLMDWLEVQKKTHHDNDAISNEVAAQAHLENYALKLFLYADKQDREQNYGKNVVKAFYTAGIVYDALTTFGELTDEAAQNRKYAKWKAAYIHNCLKNGEAPVPGPMPTEEDNLGEDSGLAPQTPSSSNDPGFLQPTTSRETPNTIGFTSNDSGSSTNLPDAAVVNILPPVPYTPELNPGGFVPYVPSRNPTPPAPSEASISGDAGSKASAVPLTPEQIAKAQKYAKWAGSALNYDDVKTAVKYMKNAVQLLETGHDPSP